MMSAPGPRAGPHEIGTAAALIAGMRDQRRDRGLFIEGRPAGQQKVRDRPQRIDIAPGVELRSPIACSGEI